MSSLARHYNALLKRQLLHFAAWSPITDRYEVGDFGAFRRGVFQRLGNIREFGVDPQPREGGASAKFSYTSSGVTMVRTQAGGALDAFPEQAVNAELAISFQEANNFYIRTQELSVTEMSSVDAVANKLHGRRDPDGRRWKSGWRVVRKVYVAKDPVILASLERSTSVSLTGSAQALRKLELGSVSADISASSSRANLLEILGGTGPLALDLFRVRVTGRAGLVSFGPGAEGQEQEAEPEPETDEDWPEEPSDDPEELFD